MNNLEDTRDRTVFIEHYPAGILTSYWRNDGTFDTFTLELYSDICSPF